MSNLVEATFGTVVRNGLEPPFGDSVESLESVMSAAVDSCVRYRIASIKSGSKEGGATFHREVISLLQSAAAEVVLKLMLAHRGGFEPMMQKSAIKGSIHALSQAAFVEFDSRLGGEIRSDRLHTVQ